MLYPGEKISFLNTDLEYSYTIGCPRTMILVALNRSSTRHISVADKTHDRLFSPTFSHFRWCFTDRMMERGPKLRDEVIVLFHKFRPKGCVDLLLDIAGQRVKYRGSSDVSPSVSVG